MANHFQDSFNQPQQTNILDALNKCAQNPVDFLAKNNVNVPKEYTNNPEQIGRYLLANMPQIQQNRVFQFVNMFRGMFGWR